MLVNVYEAKTKLSTLLDKTLAGEEVVTARAGKPVAQLTPIAPAVGTCSGVRFGGIPPAKLKLAPDFHAPLTDDDLLSL